MLINAQTKEELRVAIMDGNTLEDFQVEVAERGSTRGNIYRGVIAKIEPSLNAAFIDYGAERHGFLPIQDVVEQAWYKQPKTNGGRPRIEEVLERGKPIVVQVSKDAEDQKGAALTTNISLAGRYLVLTPFEPTRGVSRKVEDDDTRRRLKDQAKKLDVPDNCGVIVRTNALDQNKTALNRDLASLSRLWKRVSTEARKGKKSQLIYSDQDLILQALRDYLDPKITEILVDDGDAYSRAEEYLKAYMPRGGNRLKRYEEREPLFSRYGAESQIDLIYERRVQLPSGGSIVIDRTEALTAIDVNSGRSTKASSQEQTAVATNLEAAREVARQLRLRDIGGLLVVDFIDMRANRNQRKVEKALKDSLKADKARSSIGRISSNGLLEINRQRLHQALALRTHRACPTCDGTGRVSSPEMLGRSLLRRIRSRAVTAPLARVRITLHPELAEAIQNGRRREIAALEDDYGLKVEIVASPRLNLREQEVEWEKREGAARPAPSAVIQPAPKVRAAEAAVVDAADGDDDEDDSEESRGRSRRRSRGGSRRRRSGTKSSGTKSSSTKTKTDDEKAQKDASDDGKEAADGDDERKSSGRRRSSRRRSPRAKSDDGKASDAKKADAGKSKAGKRESSDDDASDSKPRRRRVGRAAKKDDDGGEATPRRRRRRVGRAAKKDDSDSGSGAGSSAGATAEAKKDDDSGGGTRTRRRRVSSRKKDGEESGSSEGDGRRRRRVGRTAKSDDSGSDAAPEGDAKPRRRRRSTRRSSDESSGDDS